MSHEGTQPLQSRNRKVSSRILSNELLELVIKEVDESNLVIKFWLTSSNYHNMLECKTYHIQPTTGCQTLSS